MKGIYQPKKEKYNDLLSLAKEMADAGVKGVLFNGHQIVVKGTKYSLYDGKITVLPAK